VVLLGQAGAGISGCEVCCRSTGRRSSLHAIYVARPGKVTQDVSIRSLGGPTSFFSRHAEGVLKTTV